MVRNGKQVGVLSTVNGFAFLYRENQGKLYMTRLLPCNNAGPTMLQVLYYLSALVVELPNLPETDSLGMTVEIPLANYKHPDPAPQVPGDQTSAVTTSGGAGAWIGTRQVQYRLIPVEGEAPGVIFEPWIAENKLGMKTFLVKMISKGIVVGKLWDGFKQNNEVRDHEAEAYLKLQPLWGRYVPELIGCADIDFFWGILLERIEVNDCIIITDECRHSSYLLIP